MSTWCWVMEVMVSTVVGGGLTIAAAGFAGHYVLQARKYTEPKMESFLKPTKICLQWWALQRKV